MNPSDFLRDTIDVVRQIETRYLELGTRLFRIREERLYLGTYDTFAEFLEAAKIGQGMASILASIHKVYVLEGHVEPERLAGVGYSNLYSAIPLVEKEGIESAVVKATTLSRSEIKDEVREAEHGVHEHNIGQDRFGICDTCKKWIKLNEEKTV